MGTWVSAFEQLLLVCRRRQLRSIAFVAPYRGAGTSTCVRALAEIASLSAFRSVVIDLSLPVNRPEPAPGTSAASRRAPLDGMPTNALYDTRRIDFSGHETFLINNPQWFRDAMNQMIGNADLVLIDLPAIAGREAGTINPIAVLAEFDSVFLVCDGDDTMRSGLVASVDEIRAAGGRIDGIVINQRSGADTGEQIARLARRAFAIIPPLARWAEKRIRGSGLSH